MPITEEEVRVAVMNSRKRKHGGRQGIPAEAFIYGGSKLHQAMARAYNKMFETHEIMEGLDEEDLYPLNKPGKPRLVTNIRPIALLNTARKIFSKIVLNRVYDRVMEYVGEKHYGFIRGRSRDQIIWAYKWMEATARR